MDNQVFVFVVSAFVAVLLFIICREILCWYWKINQHLENQRTIIEKLDRLIGQKESEQPRQNNPE